MSHPLAFDPDDPVLTRLRSICLDLPGTAEKVSHGRPTFFTRKTFAIYGATVKGDHGSGRHDRALVFLPDPSELDALDADERVFVPAYWGPYGWRAIDLDDERVDEDEVAELIEDSYRQTATAKLLAELDARRA